MTNYPPPEVQYAYPTPDQGKGPGVLALVLAFILPELGVFFGISAVLLSRRSGGVNGLGIAAITFGGIGTLVHLFVLIGLILNGVAGS